MSVKMSRRVWWLNPLFLLGITPLLIILAALMPEQSYLAGYNEPKFITGEYLLLTCLILILTVFGIMLGRQAWRTREVMRKPSDRVIIGRRIVVACDFLSGITIVAYLIWFINFIRLNGISAMVSLFSFQELSENVVNFRGNNGSISGVTTLTEFGVIDAILLPYVIKKGNRSERERALFVSILLLTFSIIRSLINSERLGIIEIAVPFIISLVAVSEQPPSRLINLAPVIAVVMLIVIFGLFEYPRSWLRHYTLVFDSYPQFVVSRVFGYYTTAINNEAMFFAYGQTSWIPYWSFLWFWSIPGLSDLYGQLANPNMNLLYHGLLAAMSNPEFNNQGGLLTFWSDFSFFGLTVYPILGFIIGTFYEQFARGDWSGRIVYPFIVLLLLELPRHFYLVENRGFVAFIAILVVFFLATQKRTGTVSESMA